MDNQFPVYIKQAVGQTLASCHFIKITLIPRWVNTVMNIVVRGLNMKPTGWFKVRPMSKITLKQYRRTTLGRYNER